LHQNQIGTKGAQKRDKVLHVKGSGALVYDIAVPEHIDFAGGIAVMNVGCSQPKVAVVSKAKPKNQPTPWFMVLP
jgi:4-aminobutyrate aminotransferase/(S)-3-amino-2-methylpropionate transaminase